MMKTRMLMGATLVAGVLASGAAMARPHMKGGMEEVRKAAGIDDATAAKIDAIAAKHKDAHRAAKERVKAARQKLQTLVAATPKDDAALTATIAEMESAMEAMRQARETQRVEVKAVLTPEQQARMILAMRGGHGGGHKDKDGDDD